MSSSVSSSPSPTDKKIRVGIMGFGALGQYLYKNLRLLESTSPIEIAYVWNRTPEKIAEVEFTLPSADGEGSGTQTHRVPEHLIMKDMKAEMESDANKKLVDVILEVCHPQVLAENVELWLQHSRAIYVGSPTGFSNEQLLKKTLELAGSLKRQIFVPTGALWGASDIAKMGARKGISALHITMRKPAASTRLEQPLQKIVEDFEQAERDCNHDMEKIAALPQSCVVFDGPIGDLCPLAPNNVNTMACAALASGPEIGFSKGRGTLVVERNSDKHIIEIDVVGKPQPGFTEPLRIHTERVNPCAVGAVTGMATYVSFYSSLLQVVATLQAEGNEGANTGLRFC